MKPHPGDLMTDDRGNIIHICPFCDTDHPKPLKDRKALLLHISVVSTYVRHVPLLQKFSNYLE
jgi:hypothetical protein